MPAWAAHRSPHGFLLRAGARIRAPAFRGPPGSEETLSAALVLSNLGTQQYYLETGCIGFSLRPKPGWTLNQAAADCEALQRPCLVAFLGTFGLRNAECHFTTMPCCLSWYLTLCRGTVWNGVSGSLERMPAGTSLWHPYLQREHAAGSQLMELARMTGSRGAQS